MGIVASDVGRLAGGKKKNGERFSSDFYGRFSDLDMDSVEEVDSLETFCRHEYSGRGFS